MIEDLMKLKKQIDTMIETYHDLHPDEYDEYSMTHTAHRDNGECVIKEEIVIDDVGQVYNPTDIRGEEYEKQTALKRVREGYYENKFRESKGKKTTGSSEGSPTLCVYGDS